MPVTRQQIKLPPLQNLYLSATTNEPSKLRNNEEPPNHEQQFNKRIKQIYWCDDALCYINDVDGGKYGHTAYGQQNC